MPDLRQRELGLWSRLRHGGCLGVTLVAAGAVHAAQPKTLLPGRLSVCLFATFPPFAEKTADGQWTGWDIDFLRRFADKLGLTFVPVPVADYEGFWTRPGADACDIAASGIADLPYRRQATGEAGIWSDPYYFVQRAFGVRREDAGNLTGVRDLAGRTILVIAGSTADVDARTRVARAGVPDVAIIGTSDDVENARRVRDGNAHDLTIAGRPDIAGPGSGPSGAGANGKGASGDARPADDPFAFGSGLGTVQYLGARRALLLCRARTVGGGGRGVERLHRPDPLWRGARHRRLSQHAPDPIERSPVRYTGCG
ncbi:MAG: hypothetical protein B7Z30_12085 [Rhizobiales bacterium 12-68-15]|nr:MAG: hypothetical protein B7Z30_12085 [Rhizobiales bacterium 12-68-15]